VNILANDGQRLFDAVTFAPLVLMGPFVIVGGVIYLLKVIGVWSLLGLAVFIVFDVLQVRLILDFESKLLGLGFPWDYFGSMPSLGYQKHGRTAISHGRDSQEHSIDQNELLGRVIHAESCW
jgi:hypothetical protein